MKFIIAKKGKMTQLYSEDGTVTPVTILEAGPVTVTQVKTDDTDGYAAVQVGFGERKEKNVSKSVLGHLQGVGPFALLKEFRVSTEDGQFEVGQVITSNTFEAGEKVDATATSKGKGFAGVVKRHGFAGGRKTHGNKDQLRMPGSIGAQEPQRVFKGMRMGGHMGAETVTTKNLEIMQVDENSIMIKGAIPGPVGGYVVIKTAKNS